MSKRNRKVNYSREAVSPSKQSRDGHLRRLLNCSNCTFIFDIRIGDGEMLRFQDGTDFTLFLKVLTRLCSAEVYQHFELNCIGLLELLLTTDFPAQLSVYLSEKTTKTAMSNGCSQTLIDVISIIDRICKSFPRASRQLFRPAAIKALNVIDAHPRFSSLKCHPDMLKHLMNIVTDEPEAYFGPEGMTNSEMVNATAPDDNFRHIPVTISRSDVHNKIVPVLHKNIVKGEYDSIEHYLDVQFRLFREDFVRPMRVAIEEYIKQAKDGQTKIKIDGVNVYHSVGIKDICIGWTAGIMYQLQFNVWRLSEVDWENTKRLLFGSLVCLSSDNFAHFTVAIIADSRPRDLQNGMVYVKFLDANFCGGFANRSYVMIESPTYYEAYAPVLKGLKQIDGHNLPFKRNLIDGSPHVFPPRHLQFKTIYTYSRNRCIRWSPLNSSTWPSPDQLELDESQCRALKAALTREIAIIQGPPAAGKTYVGLKVVQMLLDNYGGQILVVCYTNHALDQFLEGILQFCPKGIIRVGGQSKSELLDEFNLRNTKKFSKTDHQNITQLSGFTQRKIHEAKEGMAKFNKFLKFDFDNKIIPEWLLIDLDVISHDHIQQLEEATMNTDHRCNNAFEIWLEVTDYRLVISSRNSETMTNETPAMNVTENMVDDALANEERAKRLLQDEIDDDVVRLGLDDTDYGNTNYRLYDNNNNNSISSSRSKEIRDKVLKELRRSNCMSEKDARSVKNIWQLTGQQRWNLYRCWLYRAKSKVQRIVYSKQIESDKLCERLNEYRSECMLDCLRNAKILGMTTSGAARHRRNLQRIKPPILIVEEAAEVMESHVISSLTNGCQHLILIGDQQQLRPKPNVYELAKDFNLDVSLFERLINNGFPYERLQLQHRMRPEISSLLVPNIYPDLLDHEIVKQYENVAGMKTNVFFFDHKYEESNVADSKSKCNTFEAEMLISLCDYLIKQNYHPSRITVLTGYLGQVALFKNQLPEGVRCASIDGYQGEENDIILLSLVRSNVKGMVGFLSVENRVCVALSRAKIGLYCVGNFDLLTNETEVWKPIVERLTQAQLIGHQFRLVCQNHPETVTEIYTPEDFVQVSFGGCSVPCLSVLPCGHQCPLLCHVLDAQHEYIECQAVCLKPNCPFGHKCLKRCGDDCGNCQTLVLKYFNCGHENVVPCNVEPYNINCGTFTSHRLQCGHDVVIGCSQNVEHVLCVEEVARFLPCGHLSLMNCCEDPEHVKCLVEIETKLECTHTQMVPCWMDPEVFKCQQTCVRTLKCGHQKTTSCSQNLRAILCAEQCSKLLRCGHQCQLRCCSVCDQDKCTVNVLVKSPCGHTVKAPCNNRRNAERYCDAPCDAKLLCGHKCSGNCSSCHHGRIHVECKAKCDRILLDDRKCQSVCSKICLKSARGGQDHRCRHGKELTNCEKRCKWSCQHKSCSRTCHEVCDRKACDKPCPKNLHCGHPCVGFCGEPCPNFCPVCHQQTYIHKVVFGFKKGNLKSKFVLLEDCNHVIEETALDRWLTKKVNAESVEIGEKTCPKCHKVIHNNYRYGTVIKEAKEDVSTVTKTILETFTSMKMDGRRITDLVKSRTKALCQILPKTSDYLVGFLASEDFNTFDFILLSNVEHFTKQILNINDHLTAERVDLDKKLLRNEISPVKHRTYRNNIEEVKKHLVNLDEVLKGIVSKKLISDAVWADLQRDLMRIEYLKTIIITNTNVDEAYSNDVTNTHKQMNDILQTTTQPFTLQREENVKKLMNAMDIQPPNITQTYVNTTVVGSIKGRWFKCLKSGHIYSIKSGEKTNKCPKCTDCVPDLES